MTVEDWRYVAACVVALAFAVIMVRANVRRR